MSDTRRLRAPADLLESGIEDVQVAFSVTFRVQKGAERCRKVQKGADTVL
jgi:hypothetical protein